MWDVAFEHFSELFRFISRLLPAHSFDERVLRLVWIWILCVCVYVNGLKFVELGASP